jgi:hypothetical protein
MSARRVFHPCPPGIDPVHWQMGLALVSPPEPRPVGPAMRDVLALAVMPTARFIARHTCAAARALWAALRAAFTTYRESINADA